MLTSPLTQRTAGRHNNHYSRADKHHSPSHTTQPGRKGSLHNKHHHKQDSHFVRGTSRQGRRYLETDKHLKHQEARKHRHKHRHKQRRAAAGHPQQKEGDTSSSAPHKQQHKRREGQGPIRMAHRDKKEWIKEQFRIHGLHKPNHHTWTQAEDQLMRYLNAKPSNPAPPVDIAAVLKSQQEWVTNTPARGSKADTEATERYQQRQAAQEAATEKTHTTPQTASDHRQSQPYPGQAAPGRSSSDQEGQRGAETSSSSRGQPGQQQSPLEAQSSHHTPTADLPAQPQPQHAARQAKPERGHTTPGQTPHTQARPQTTDTRSPAKPGAAGDTRGSSSPSHEQASSSWESLPNRPPPASSPLDVPAGAHNNTRLLIPAYTWREQHLAKYRLQLYLTTGHTPITWPPILPVGPAMAIVYQSMPAGIWLAASVRHMGHSPPYPPYHDGATVVASKQNPLAEGEQYFLGMGVSIFMRAVGLWKWQLYTLGALHSLGGYTHPLPGEQDEQGAPPQTDPSASSSSRGKEARQQQEQSQQSTKEAAAAEQSRSDQQQTGHEDTSNPARTRNAAAATCKGQGTTSSSPTSSDSDKPAHAAPGKHRRRQRDQLAQRGQNGPTKPHEPRGERPHGALATAQAMDKQTGPKQYQRRPPVSCREGHPAAPAGFEDRVSKKAEQQQQEPGGCILRVLELTRGEAHLQAQQALCALQPPHGNRAKRDDRRSKQQPRGTPHRPGTARLRTATPPKPAPNSGRPS